MVSNHTFEEQLRKLISETQDELNGVHAQLQSLEERRLALAEELKSYEASLRGYLKRIGKEQKEEQPPDWNRLFKKCRSHKDRLLAIAKHSGRELKFNSAVDILYNGEFIKSKSRANAYTQLYAIVTDMVDNKILERAERGIYRIPRHS
jgi:septal ring factor EnvC (AmiA/AmiB activator)